jgi:hypothetical protein
MAVRANWFVEDDLPADTATLPPAEERIEDVGVPLDLRDPSSLVPTLTNLLNQEAAMFNQGITCAVKDRPDTSCSACLWAHDNEDGHPLQMLCQIGREQERITTTAAHLKLR